MNEDKGNVINMEAEIIKDTILNFIVPLIAFVICLLIGFVFIYPAYKALPELRNQIGQKTQLRDVLKAKKSNLDKLVDFKSVVDENSTLVNKVLVSEPMIPELLNQVDQIVKETGMNVTKLNYSYGVQTKDKAYQSVDVSLSTEGSYDQLITFLKNVEDGARLINISDLRYGLDVNSGTEVLTTSYNLTSPYLFVESKAVTDDPVTLNISDQKFIDFVNKLKTFKFYDYSTPAFPAVEELSPESTSGGTLQSGTQPGGTVSGGTGPSGTTTSGTQPSSGTN